MTLTTGEDFDAVERGVSKTMSLASKLAKTPHYAKLGEAGIFAIAQVAISMGLPLMECLNGELYFVNGRVGMSYEAMNKHIRRAGHSVVIKELNDKQCILIGKRKDNNDTAEICFSYEDAKKAGLARSGGSYDKHTKTMLFARCLSQLKRFLFPDVCTKIYLKEELEEIEASESSKEMAVELAQPAPVAVTISPEEASKLEAIIGDDAPYKSKVLGFYKIESLDQLPLKAYPAVLRSALDNDAKRRAEVINIRTDEINEEEEAHEDVE